MLEKEYRLDFFKENGFIRKKCVSCGTPFWTTNYLAQHCGDTPCVEYKFIDSPIIPKEYSTDAMRNSFIDYFKAHGHTALDRYPVIARWRNDIYLTIASIADFQPHVTSGAVDPPANPLVISQPCIRLNDLDSVGRSGRHLTNFEMMGHHAFNSPEEDIYWKEEAVEYCFDYYTDTLGIDPLSLTFREDPWVGGGNAGPALEVLAGGLELATLVFMSMERDPNGDVELKGDHYSPMDMRVVDPGYGLERMVWASQGTPTIYEAIHPTLTEILKEYTGVASVVAEPKYRKLFHEHAKLAGIMAIDTPGQLRAMRQELLRRLTKRGFDLTMGELAEIMTPLEQIYAIADHTRCIAFMLGDGVVPSNVRAGYLTRLVIRRALRLMAELDIDIGLQELVNKQLDEMRSFPDLQRQRSTILDILDIEEERYEDTLTKGRRIIRSVTKDLGSDEQIPLEQLVDLYDTHGLHPDYVKRTAAEFGVEVEVPDTFSSILAARHSSAEPGEGAVEEEREYDLPPTKLLYYSSPNQYEFESPVIYSDDNEVVLASTAFYPEGGGQPSDIGEMVTSQRRYKVTDVDRYGDVVVHTIDGSIPVGEIVRGKVDEERRMTLMRQHTGTHIINGAARRLLGDHVWQEGAQKGLERSRLDIAHYARLTAEEVREIELEANRVVLKGLPVTKKVMRRDKAERKYGFRLYQGGVPATNELRVVAIRNYDVEACGGTHCNSTAEVGTIKILRTERIQDGIERIEFSAGIPAIERIQDMEQLLIQSSEVLSVLPAHLPKSVERFFEEWKALRKEVQDLLAEAALGRAYALREEAETVAGTAVLVTQTDMDRDGLMNLAKELTKSGGFAVVLAGGTDSDSVVLIGARSDDVDVNMSPIVRAASKLLGGGGGGRPDFAQGGGSNRDALPAALDLAREQLEDALRADAAATASE